MRLDKESIIKNVASRQCSMVWDHGSRDYCGIHDDYGDKDSGFCNDSYQEASKYLLPASELIESGVRWSIAKDVKKTRSMLRSADEGMHQELYEVAILTCTIILAIVEGDY